MLELESTCLHKKEYRTHKLWVQIQELKGELETLYKSLGKNFQLTSMDN
jgi:hypothetical protein